MIPAQHTQAWQMKFLLLAEHISTWSKDPSTKVGAVIVAPDKTITSCGYNGFPRGIEDSKGALADRTVKYANTVHAEMNAILAANQSVVGHALYINLPPCVRCSVHIIQSGITSVIHTAFTDEQKERWGDSYEASKLVLEDAGVSLHSIDV